MTTATIANNIATNFVSMEALVLIGPTGGRELPRPPHNIQSQELKSSSFPAPVHIVIFCAIEKAGMGKSTAALESNAVAAVVLFRPTGGQPEVTVSSVQYLVTTPQTSPNSCLYAISADSTSGLSGECVPELALGPKAASAVLLISAYRRPEVAPPHLQYPLQGSQTKHNPYPYAYSCDSEQWIGRGLIPS